MQCGVILDHLPSLADKVIAGTLALDAAHKQVTGHCAPAPQGDVPLHRQCYSGSLHVV